jgi:hypothetical protein
MQTFVSLVDFSQLALFFDLSLQFVILHLLISVIHYYMFVHSSTICFLVALLVDIPEDYCLILYFPFTTHFVNMTNPIQLNYSDKWKYI